MAGAIFSTQSFERLEFGLELFGYEAPDFTVSHVDITRVISYWGGVEYFAFVTQD